MKKLFAISLAILLSVSVVYFADAANTNNSGPGDILGQGKMDSQPHKIFRLVRFTPRLGGTNAVTLSADSIVVWATTVSGDDGVTITTSTTSSDTAVAGIVVADILTPEFGALGNTATADIGKRNWGWLQTYGLSSVGVQTSASGLIAANGAFGTSSADGYASAFTFDTAAYYQGSGSSALQWGIAGFACDAPGSAVGGTKVKVFLKGLD